MRIMTPRMIAATHAGEPEHESRVAKALPTMPW